MITLVEFDGDAAARRFVVTDGNASDGTPLIRVTAADEFPIGVTDDTASSDGDRTNFVAANETTWVVDSGEAVPAGSMVCSGADGVAMVADTDSPFVVAVALTAAAATGDPVTIAPLRGTGQGGGSAPAVTWATISGKPAVIGAGADQATARTAIGAGTSSLANGSTAGAALASAGAAGTATTSAHSDHVHPFPTAANVGAAPTSHTHTVSQVTDLTAAKLMTGSIAPINNQSGDFADLTAVTQAYNILIGALRTRGIISGS